MSEEKFFYANGVEAQAGTYDITVKFLRVGSPTVLQVTGTMNVREAKPELLETLSVSMAPSHAKSMMAALAAGIVAYEKGVGGKVQVSAAVEKAFQDAIARLLEK
jgi:hypothetical protein